VAPQLKQIPTVYVNGENLDASKLAIKYRSFAQTKTQILTPDQHSPIGGNRYFVGREPLSKSYQFGIISETKPVSIDNIAVTVVLSNKFM
jgi:hypothetical protein